ncbi:MAG: DUF4394 domain-containing protein [Planctomycetia bacterium]|nr:DUF4394 domain-containing protein [Planctomycetia bacterium]
MTNPERNARNRFRPRVTPLEDRTTPAAAIALSNNTLFAFDTGTPGNIPAGIGVTGLGTGENLVGIDFRPQNGQLYGLTSNGAGGVRLYAISPDTGIAVPLTPAPVQFDDGGGSPVPIAGTNFGFDFNPFADRVRVVTDAGINFRINPNTGFIIDGSTNDPGVNADGAVNGGTTTLDGTAYTNNAPNATATTQYTLDSSTTKLFTQNPPNDGTQKNAVAVTLGASVLDFTAVNGFDIPSGVNVATSGDLATGNGFAVLTTTGGPSLYTINLNTGQANLVGALGIAGGPPIQGFTVQPNDGAAGIPFVGVAGNSVVRFSSKSATTVVAVPIPSGLSLGEAVVGLDRRPATGQYFALVHNSAAGTVRIALVDPQTAALTNVGGGVPVALVNAAGSPITFPAGTSFGIDFNPTVDKLRVVASTGINFRIDPTTGAALDGNATFAGTQPDAALNSGATAGTGTAYTNSFHKATVTTQYTLDAVTNSLFVQNPPNDGVLVGGLPITVAGTAIDFTDANAFDIPSNVRVTASGSTATGLAYAALTVAGDTSLYSINLATGAATKLGPIGIGTTPLVGLVASETATSNAGLTGTSDYGLGSDVGVASMTKLLAADGTLNQTAQPYGTFTGGVRVATGDFNGDGVDDLVVGSGPGMVTNVTILDGKTDGIIVSFSPFEASFTGGVFVAAGDLTGDGAPELVVTPDQGGGPRVRVFRSGNIGDVLADFLGIADLRFRGGARPAIGDVNGDGFGDLGVAAGFGGGPRVAVFDGTTLPGNEPVRLFNDFFAFENTLRNGVFLALGDIDGDGKADVIAGGGPGGGPRVTVFNGNLLVTSGGATVTPLANFFAYDDTNRSGVRLAVKDLDGDTLADLVTGNGPGVTNRVKFFAGSAIKAAAVGATPPSFNEFDPLFGSTNGVFVG